MKKIILLSLLLAGAYKGYLAYAKSAAGAYDESGAPVVLLFTVDGCASPCEDARKLLQRRDVDYEEVVVTDGEEQLERWERFGAINTLPVLVAGDERVAGFDKWQYISVLAVNFGSEHLTVSEADILNKNFTASGEPRLVLYTMDGCGYCEAALRQLREDGIDFEERNTSNDYTAKSELDKFEAGTPLIFYGYRRFSGWSSGIYESLRAVM